jgi:hypothetical protein
MGKAKWVKAKRGRWGERGGGWVEKEVMSKTAKSAEVVDGERDEGNALGIES